MDPRIEWGRATLYIRTASGETRRAEHANGGGTHPRPNKELRSVGVLKGNVELKDAGKKSKAGKFSL